MIKRDQQELVLLVEEIELTSTTLNRNARFAFYSSNFDDNNGNLGFLKHSNAKLTGLSKVLLKLVTGLEDIFMSAGFQEESSLILSCLRYFEFSDQKRYFTI